jgi:hypothetical protein
MVTGINAWRFFAAMTNKRKSSQFSYGSYAVILRMINIAASYHALGAFIAFF